MSFVTFSSHVHQTDSHIYRKPSSKLLSCSCWKASPPLKHYMSLALISRTISQYGTSYYQTLQDPQESYHRSFNFAVAVLYAVVQNSTEVKTLCVLLRQGHCGQQQRPSEVIPHFYGRVEDGWPHFKAQRGQRGWEGKHLVLDACSSTMNSIYEVRPEGWTPLSDYFSWSSSQRNFTGCKRNIFCQYKGRFAKFRA